MLYFFAWVCGLLLEVQQISLVRTMGRLGGLSQSSSDVGSAKVSEFQSCFDFVVTCRPKHSTHRPQGSTSEESMIISLGLASKIIGCSYGLTPDFSGLPTTHLLIGRRLLHLLPLEVCIILRLPWRGESGNLNFTVLRTSTSSGRETICLQQLTSQDLPSQNHAPLAFHSVHVLCSDSHLLHCSKNTTVMVNIQA